MKSTGAIICNYNKADFVINGIQSVLESKTDDYDIFMVDNKTKMLRTPAETRRPAA